MPSIHSCLVQCDAVDVLCISQDRCHPPHHNQLLWLLHRDYLHWGFHLLCTQEDSNCDTACVDDWRFRVDPHLNSLFCKRPNARPRSWLGLSTLLCERIRRTSLHIETSDANQKRGVHATFLVIISHCQRGHVVLLWPSNK